MLVILDPKVMMAPPNRNGKLESAPGGYGPPGGGWGPPGGGGYGAPPAPPAGGGYGAPPGGGGYGAPPAGGFGAPAGAAGPPPIIMMPGAGGDVNTTLPLVLNIALSALCFGTCIGSVLGVVGIVFAFQATNAKTAGDLVTAKAKARQSMTTFFVAAGIGLLLYLFIGAWQFLALAPAPR